MVIPVGPVEGAQSLFLYTRHESTLTRKEITGVRYVPLIAQP